MKRTLETEIPQSPRFAVQRLIPPMSRRSCARTQLQIRQVIRRVNCRTA